MLTCVCENFSMKTNWILDFKKFLGGSMVHLDLSGWILRYKKGVGEFNEVWDMKRRK